MTIQNVGIVPIKKGLNTADDSAAPILFRTMMLARSAYEVESTSERSRAGLDRATAGGRKPGLPPTLPEEQTQESRRMYAEIPSIRRVARILDVSHGTVKRAVEEVGQPVTGEA